MKWFAILLCVSLFCFSNVVRADMDAQIAAVERAQHAQDAANNAAWKKRQESKLAKEKYDEQLRQLEIDSIKADLAQKQARAKRADDFVNKELANADAKNDLIKSKAESNRNISEGLKESLSKEKSASASVIAVINGLN